MSHVLYREELLEHWKNPQNWGEVVDADFVIDDHNPLCGDSIHLSGKVSDGKMVDLRFTAAGCVISKAAASMLTEFVKGRSIGEITNLSQEDLLKLLEIPLTAARLKCALLAYSALNKALISRKSP